MSLPFDVLGGGLGDCSVVYFGNDWAAENRTSSHHIATRVGQRFPLLYVETPGLRAPQINSRDIGKLFRKLGNAMRNPTQIGPHMWRMTVPQIPLRKVPGVQWFNRRVSIWAVRRALRILGFKRRISWFAVPHPGFLAGKLGEDLVVYYCVDDYAAHPGVDSVTIGRADEALTRAADLVFVAPPALVEAKKRLNSSSIFSPHGVDVELFGRANDPQTPLPDGIQAWARPIVGFFGSLADWIDLDLIERIAKARPAYTILLVGQSFVDTSALRSLPNVVLAGPQPYPTLPRWARAFDAAIIPYKLNRQVLNANPLKLREYLATGVPIVSVSNPEIERFAEHIRIAHGGDEFLKALDAAV